MPRDLPNGWLKSPVDPHDVLAVFRSLRLKPAFVLRAYQFREGGNGHAFVYATPAEAPFPQPDACERRAGPFLDPVGSKYSNRL
jgi:hypothetical protein